MKPMARTPPGFADRGGAMAETERKGSGFGPIPEPLKTAQLQGHGCLTRFPERSEPNPPKVQHKTLHVANLPGERFRRFRKRYNSKRSKVLRRLQRFRIWPFSWLT